MAIALGSWAVEAEVPDPGSLQMPGEAALAGRRVQEEGEEELEGTD